MHLIIIICLLLPLYIILCRHTLPSFLAVDRALRFFARPGFALLGANAIDKEDLIVFSLEAKLVRAGQLEVCPRFA